MKTPVADAAGRDASPSGTARDIRAPIIVWSVTQGSCRRVHPIINCRFATATMSAAPWRRASPSESIADF